MYGQTTGHGAQALRRLEAAYPVAMALPARRRRGRPGRARRAHLRRAAGPHRLDERQRGRPSATPAARAAAMGRYARNAMVQGAAAELFKRWAVTVRARLAGRGARIVLCLHDELLVHAPAADGDAVARLVDDVPPGGGPPAGRPTATCASSPTAVSAAGPTPLVRAPASESSGSATDRLRAMPHAACASTTTGSGWRSWSTGRDDGPAVLLLHGVSGSTATYDFLVPGYPGHRLHRLDFRGHGRSDRAPGAYLLDDYASDAEAVLDAIGPALIVGHSLGGITADVRRPAPARPREGAVPGGPAAVLRGQGRRTSRRRSPSCSR